MGDVVFHIRPSSDGPQRSAWPLGNYNPGGNTPPVNSSIADGDELTLTFLNAGANVAAANQAFLGGNDGVVEQASIGAVFSSFMPQNWGMPGDHGTFVRNAITLNGSKSLCHSRENNDFQFGIRYDTGAPRRTLFARYSYFFDNPNNLTVGQLKQYRVCGKLTYGGGLHDQDIANILLTRYNSTALTVQNRGNDLDPEGGGANTAIYRGQADPTSWGTFHAANEWITVEVAITINSAPGVPDGRVHWVARRSLTGEIIGEWTVSNNAIWTHGQPYRYHVLQMYLGNGFDSTCKVYIDRDVYFSHSDSTAVPRYIVVGDAPVWNQVQKQTVCRYSEWTDIGGNARVKFKFNKGAHASTNGLYAYAMLGPNTPADVHGVALVQQAPEPERSVSLSGNILTLTGVDLPQRSRAAPVIWDNFADMTEGQTMYQRVPPVLNANISTYWSASSRGAGQRPYATLNGNRVAGKPSSYHSLSSNNYNCSLRVRHDLPLTQPSPVYLSFWWKSQPGGNNRQVKPLVFYGRRPPSGELPTFYLGMGNYESFPQYLTPDGLGNYGAIDDDMRTSTQDDDIVNVAHRGLTSWGDIIGRYVKFELVVVQSSPGQADGMYACRVYDPDAPGGPRKYETIRSGIATKGLGEYGWTDFDIGSYAGGFSGIPCDCPVWVDDPCFDDGENHARVVIGNHADYAQCTIVEDQPGIYWSGTEAECAFNRGRFSSGESVYVFLVTGAGHSGHGSATLFGSVVVPGTQGGNADLSWSAPEGLVNGKTITVSSDTAVFSQPSKQLYLGFGMGWLYEQLDGAVLPSTINVGGEVWHQQSSDEHFVGRTVVTIDGRKVLRSVLKPNTASSPYGAGFLYWDNGGPLLPQETVYMFKSSRLSIGSLPSGDYQWKQLRVWPTDQVSGDISANCAYIPFGPGGSGSVQSNNGTEEDIRYNASIPRGVVGEGLWSSFGWAWRINTTDVEDGDMATHYKVEGSLGLIRRRPSRTLYDPTRTVYPTNVVRSSSVLRPRYISTQDYIGNTSAGDSDFVVDITDLYFKVGGDLFLLADHADLSQCVENPIPLVPIAFNGVSSWTFRLWKGEMASFSGKYIHRLDSMLNPIQVVALGVN